MYEPNRILVQLLAIFAIFIVGCESPDHAAVPVSIQQQPPFSYEGRIGRIWGGDNFEIVDGKELHYVFIRGIDCPEPGQAFHVEAKTKLRELCRQKTAIINVVGRDVWKREECDMSAKDMSNGESVEPAIELLQAGLAWFDKSEGPWAERFELAEAEAREKKIGIWSQSNPVPPWKVWERHVKQIRN